MHVMLIIKKDGILCFFPRIPGVLNSMGGPVGETGPGGAWCYTACLHQAAVKPLLFPVVSLLLGQGWCSQEHFCTGDIFSLL